MKNVNHKTALIISILGVFLLLVGSSYAIFSGSIKSDKKQIVKAGKVKVELVEPQVGLDLGEVEAMSDVDGLAQTSYYEFSISNTGDTKASYKLFLLDDADAIAEYTGTLLDDSYIKIGLEKDGNEIGPLSLKDSNRLIDEGELNVGASHNYKLRIWLNFGTLTDAEIEGMKGYSKFLKLKITAEQVLEDVNKLKTAILGVNNSNVVSSGDGLYVSTETNSGNPTYYYKGAVENNYVSFANQTWRIVRINEDGSIRLIMQDGINNNTVYVFNATNNNYSYMYYSNSSIKPIIENWYTTNLTNYDDKIVTSEYCEQAKVKRDDLSTAANATMALYTDYTPNYRCATDGNGKGIIDAKIGIISIDEVVLAGYPFLSGSQINNTSIYLRNNQNYWTISPAGFDSAASAYAWIVIDDGYTAYSGVKNQAVLRPVISIVTDSIITSGTGTSADPYII